MPLALRAGSGAARTIIPHIAETARRCLFKRWPDIESPRGVTCTRYPRGPIPYSGRTACRPTFPSCRHVHRHRGRSRRDPLAFDQGGELAAAVELRRLFPGATDNTEVRECARTIAAWRALQL